jgi:23S rRNA (adenine2503-C2)-methyltransferase
MPKPHLLEQTPPGLKTWFTQHGLPAYRAAQTWRWVFHKRAGSFDEMTDLPHALRSRLAEELSIFSTQVARHRKAADGTEKLLLNTPDQQRIECVLLRDDRRRRTACISSQIGCAMGCVFCASGLDGLARNLTSGEILEQLLLVQRLLPPDDRLSHVVVMGIGEPLANLDALLPALATATSADGLAISARRVTISTVGLPAAIRRLAQADCQYHLAVSLHAPDDRLRSQLVPVNRTWPINSILAATDHYFRQTGRRVTFEYVLLGGLNDGPEQARELLRLLQGRPVLVNLIPYNRVVDLDYRAPSPAATARFVESLRKGHLNVKLRHRKGRRIDAACGQLRRRA